MTKVTRHRRLARLVGLVLVATATWGCSPPPGQVAPPRFRLEGSLTQLMALGYDECRLRLDYDPNNPAPTDTLGIEFVRLRPMGSGSLDDGGMAMAGDSEDMVLKIGYLLAGDAPPANARLDLTFLDQNGISRTTLSRNVANDPRRAFPPLRVGSLFLDRAPDRLAMNIVNGEFNLTFENGIEVASGRTVFGRFAAKVIPP
ncbi:MAG: hypothetical protein JNJ54_08655 [Myxococcaceae bacterium]|nr:hypothetical protein [Myxococcaceae bacterium]